MCVNNRVENSLATYIVTIFFGDNYSM